MPTTLEQWLEQPAPTSEDIMAAHGSDDGTFILIDREAPVILKRTRGYMAATQWAELICPDHAIFVGPPDARSFAQFSEYEMQRMHLHTTGTELPLKPYVEMAKSMAEVAKNFLIDETTEGELAARVKAMYPNEPDMPDRNTPYVPHVAPRAVKPAGEGSSPVPGRPKAGTSTGLVWDICDQVKASGSMDRKQMIAACERQGINASTAATQYSKWKATQ